MLKITDIPSAWTDVRQIESGVEKYPILVRFRLIGSVYYAAIDKDGKHWIRKSPLGIKGLTGCSNTKMKELDK
mgnify:CR=1 FL=1